MMPITLPDYFDKYGMPCQLNGDVGDSCQRVGWIGSIQELRKKQGLEEAKLPFEFDKALQLVEPIPGIYVRHPFPLATEMWQSKPEEFSRDQQAALRKALIFRRDGKALWRMFKAHAKRLFKYQNKDWGMALDEYLRGFVYCAGFFSYPFVPIIWVFLNVFDLAFLFTALMVCGKLPRWKHETKKFIGFEPSHTSDDLNLFLDLMLSKSLPTFTSLLAIKIYKRRPKAEHSGDEKNNVMGALVSYFRKDAGGNPMLAEVARPIVEKHFG